MTTEAYVVKLLKTAPMATAEQLARLSTLLDPVLPGPARADGRGDRDFPPGAQAAGELKKRWPARRTTAGRPSIHEGIHP